MREAEGGEREGMVREAEKREVEVERRGEARETESEGGGERRERERRKGEE